MSAEVRDPRRTLPRAPVFRGCVVLLFDRFDDSAGTIAVLVSRPAPEVSATSGVFHATSPCDHPLNRFLWQSRGNSCHGGLPASSRRTVSGSRECHFVSGIGNTDVVARGIRNHPRGRRVHFLIVQALVFPADRAAHSNSETTRGGVPGL